MTFGGAPGRGLDRFRHEPASWRRGGHYGRYLANGRRVLSTNPMPGQNATCGDQGSTAWRLSSSAGRRGELAWRCVDKVKGKSPMAAAVKGTGTGMSMSMSLSMTCVAIIARVQ